MSSYDYRIEYQGVHIPTKEWRRFSRGQSTIEARIDLHGYHRYDAKELLQKFIEDCVEDGKTTVLVIHGKGEILKDMVDETCRYMPEVLAFVSAVPKHGGTGAIYLRLKKL